MDPSRSSSASLFRLGRRVAILAATAFSFTASALFAQNQPVLIKLEDNGGNDIVEIFDCSRDGTVAIGASSQRPNTPPAPRDKLDFADGPWGLPIEDLRHVTCDDVAGTHSTIHFPTNELVNHIVRSVILPRDANARLVFVNTLDPNGKEDAYVWFVDYTNDPDPDTTDVVRIDSNLDVRCCSANGRLAWCDDGFYSNVFWRCERIGDQYSTTPVSIPIDRRVPANEDISIQEETVDCCSDDGTIVYGREQDLHYYRATNNEPGAWAGNYTWVYNDGGTGLTVDGDPNHRDPRNLICTDDGQLAICAETFRIQYQTRNPQLTFFRGFTPGASFYFPLAIRNNLQAFGHIEDGQDVVPVTSDAPNNEFTTLKLLVGDERGQEVTADEDIARILGYSITTDGAGTETARTLVRWTPSLTFVERLDYVYGIDPDPLPEPTNNVVTLFAASRSLEHIYCTYEAGGSPVQTYRITKPVDDPPTLVTASVSTNGKLLTLQFSEDVIRNNDPTVTLSGGPVVLTFNDGDGTSVHTYDIDRIVQFGETGTLDLPFGSVTDFGLNENPDILGFDIDNQSTVGQPPPDTTPPTVTSAVIDIDGETFTLVFDESVVDKKLPRLTLDGGAVTASFQNGRNTNTLTYQLSRTVFVDETGTWRLADGAVEDLAGNLIVADTGSILNNSDVEDPNEPEPPPPPKPTTSEKRPLGTYANYFVEASYNTSANFYLDPAGYTENAYYAYLTSYYSLLYRYYAGDTVRWGGSKTRAQALQAYKDLRYQQVLMSYYAMQFAVNDYALTFSNTSYSVFVYSYYAYDYGVQDLNEP